MIGRSIQVFKSFCASHLTTFYRYHFHGQYKLWEFDLKHSSVFDWFNHKFSTLLVEIQTMIPKARRLYLAYKAQVCNHNQLFCNIQRECTKESALKASKRFQASTALQHHVKFQCFLWVCLCVYCVLTPLQHWIELLNSIKTKSLLQAQVLWGSSGED